MNNQVIKLSFVIFIAGLILVLQASAQEYKGKVVGISDGDTFTLLTTNKARLKIRLAEIDTPENTQPYGTRAKQALSHLIFGKEVRVVQQDKDRYGRVVASVYLGNLWVNRQLVQEGMAWVYRKYSKNPELLKDEQKARVAMCGLWSLPITDQVPPWEWRNGKKPSTNKATPKLDLTASTKSTEEQKFTCGPKTRCSEMTSCEEVMFYLKECGISQLDRDKDGIPCEKLCL